MANRAKLKNKQNHFRQRLYLGQGIVMLPTLREEKKGEKSSENKR